MYNPFYPSLVPFPFIIPNTRNALRRVDVNGIYELQTNSVQVSEASADYGICPSAYNALPCESIVLLKIHAAVPESGASLPVTIVVPARTTTLATSSTTTSGSTAKTPVVDSNDGAVSGSDITSATEALAYINKKTGKIRLLGFQSASSSSASADTKTE